MGGNSGDDRDSVIHGFIDSDDEGEEKDTDSYNFSVYSIVILIQNLPDYIISV